MKDVANVHQNMAADSERELRLAECRALNGGNEQRARVENGGQRGDPALVVVLGAVVTKNGIGDVGLEHRRRPALPLRKQLVQCLISAIEVMAQQEFARSWRRTGAGVEQSYLGLPYRERGIEHRHITNHQGDKAQPRSCFGDDQETGSLVYRNNVAKTERKQCRATDIEAGAKLADDPRRMERIRERCVQAEVDEGISGHKSDGPHHKQHQQRERAVVAVKLLPLSTIVHQVDKVCPRSPGGDKEKSREAKSRHRAARKNDGLERIQQYRNEKK